MAHQTMSLVIDPITWNGEFPESPSNWGSKSAASTRPPTGAGERDRRDRSWWLMSPGCTSGNPEDAEDEFLHDNDQAAMEEECLRCCRIDAAAASCLEKFGGSARNTVLQSYDRVSAYLRYRNHLTDQMLRSRNAKVMDQALKNKQAETNIGLLRGSVILRSNGETLAKAGELALQNEKDQMVHLDRRKLSHDDVSDSEGSEPEVYVPAVRHSVMMTQKVQMVVQKLKGNGDAERKDKAENGSPTSPSSGAADSARPSPTAASDPDGPRTPRKAALSGDERRSLFQSQGGVTNRSRSGVRSSGARFTSFTGVTDSEPVSPRTPRSTTTQFTEVASPRKPTALNPERFLSQADSSSGKQAQTATPQPFFRKKPSMKHAQMFKSSQGSD